MTDTVKRFAARRKLTCVAFAAAAGSFLAANISIPYLLFIPAAVLTATAAVILRKTRMCFSLVMICILLLFAGYMSFCSEQPAELPEGKYDIEARICAFPLEQNEKQRTVLTLDDVKLDSREFSYKIRLYVYNSDMHYEYGQTLYIKQSKLSVPEGASYEGGFDFRSYLWRNGIALTGSSSDDRITVTAEKHSFLNILYRVREYLAGKADMIFGVQSDVMKAMLLGDKSELNEETYYSFRQTGIAHIIALSGLHVSCIALILNWLLSLMHVRRLIKDISVVAILMLYTCMTGASASTVRALIMYAVFCLTAECGYPADMLNRLSFAFVAQVTANPMITLDTGFMLSYAAIYAILCINDIGNEIAGIGGDDRSVLNYIAETGVTSFSVQTVSYPILANEFGSIPIVTIPANMILVPFAGMTLIVGIAALFLACISLEIGTIAAYPVCIIWKVIKEVAEALSDLSFSVLTVRAWNVLAAAAYFAAAFVISPYISKNMSRRKWGYAALISIAVIASAVPVFASDDLKVTFINVGYGDSALIEAQGRVYMLDCGRDNGRAEDYAASTGFRLSGIILTHSDSDHCGGLSDVLRGNSTATVYLPECWDRMEVSEETESLLKDRDKTYLSKGDELLLSPDITAFVLWPPEGYIPAEDNDGCLVLNIVYGDASVLFMADISDKLDSMCCAPAQLIKISHHGSKYATSTDMLEHVKPETAVISVNSNGFGHPTDDVMNRLGEAGSHVYRTDQCGIVEIEFLRNGVYNIDTYMNPEETDDT